MLDLNTWSLLPSVQDFGVSIGSAGFLGGPPDSGVVVTAFLFPWLPASHHRSARCSLLVRFSVSLWTIKSAQKVGRAEVNIPH